MELSVVMPCLNEEQTVATCIEKALSSMRSLGISGEVLIADNGSTDRSIELATAAGARVIQIAAKGYGNALRGGIEQARGKFVIMGDADDSYEFENLGPFITKLREGYDLVMGNRFKGGIEPGAMPPLHRYLGNPVLSFVGRLFFKSKIGDFHCGLRGFNKEKILGLSLNSGGMEFASEMVVKASLQNLNITEVPTILRPDGRDKAPHLRSWRDGWRHLRFLLAASPRWLFWYPGLLLLILGIAIQAVLLPGNLLFQNFGLDIHTMLYAGGFTMLGFQMVLLAVVLKLIGAEMGVLRGDGYVTDVQKFFTLERSIFVGVFLVISGALIGGLHLYEWQQVEFKGYDPTVGMRYAIPAVTLGVCGVQVICAAFCIFAFRIYRQG